MFKTIWFCDFCDSFSDTYKNNFTYEGKRALYDYMNALEEDIGTPIELDTIALCCEYDEYEDAMEAASNYFEFEGMTFWEDWEELETREDVEKKAIKFLEDRTIVIVFDKWIIIQAF